MSDFFCFLIVVNCCELGRALFAVVEWIAGSATHFSRPTPHICELVIVYPSASAMMPTTIAPAAIRRRVESPSESNRAPMAAPMRMEISRAGAT